MFSSMKPRSGATTGGTRFGSARSGPASGVSGSPGGYVRSQSANPLGAGGAPSTPMSSGTPADLTRQRDIDLKQRTQDRVMQVQNERNKFGQSQTGAPAPNPASQNMGAYKNQFMPALGRALESGAIRPPTPADLAAEQYRQRQSQQPGPLPNTVYDAPADAPNSFMGQFASAVRPQNAADLALQRQRMVGPERRPLMRNLYGM